MAKADLKTKATDASVEDFINSVADEQAREDCRKIASMMKKTTGEEPKLWSSNIVGFGTYHYKYDSGREGEWFVTGFSPRKTNLTVYLTDTTIIDDEAMSKLGKFKAGKGCIYFKKLSDVDEKILEALIKKTVSKKGK